MSMQDYLSGIDLEKMKYVLSIKEDYNSGRLSLEDARKALKERVQTLKPYEIALAEQELQEIEDDECRKEDIQGMLSLFEGLMDTSRPELPEDHPINRYYEENDHLRGLFQKVRELKTRKFIKNEWLGLYDEIKRWKIHLSRKQNQLYSILERKGFDRPTTTMWLLDNFVRDEITTAYELLVDDAEEQFLNMQDQLLFDVEDLMQKEETVLYPTSLAMISPKEFEEMKSGDYEIGFAYTEAPEHREAERPKAPQEAPSGFMQELGALLGKYGLSSGGKDEVLDVATGKLTLEQINLIFRHMPVDLSYVDENDLVAFYSDTDHRVFPRSKNVIGRLVQNCHPRSSVHVVEEIIEKFRSGEEDSVDFWINKPGLFIYIHYVAVRDEKGRFRGVLEMMQNATHIRALEGSRTLLQWGSSSQPEEVAEQPQEAEAPEEDEPSAVGEITPETKLKALLSHYPQLKEELVKINEKFSMLSTPLARLMLPKATIKTMAERSGMKLEELLKAIKEKISSLEK